LKARTRSDYLTGYKRPAEQLRELHRLGYFRARRGNVTGEVILERAHVDAVAAGSRCGQLGRTCATAPNFEPSHEPIRRAAAARVPQGPLVLPRHGAEGKKRIWTKLTMIRDGIPALYRKLADMKARDIAPGPHAHADHRLAGEVSATRGKKTRPTTSGSRTPSARRSPSSAPAK
jgi:hypothetical protein